MPTFEIDHGGKTYEVDAPDMATAASSFPGASSPATSPALQVANPSQNWSNIGTNSLQEAGIRPALTNREALLGRLMAMIPANFGDELPAAFKAGRLGPPLPALIQANATPENQAIYDKTLADARQTRSRYETAHPVESTALGVGSNVAAALASGQPETLGGMIRQGTTLGALQGFGGGEGWLDRLTKAGIGGVEGGLLSALVGSAANWAERKATPPASLGAAYTQNIADKSGVDVNSLPTTTKPLTAAEALGPNAQTQLMALGRREGATGSALAPAMAERAAGRSDRILEDMAQSAGIHPDAAKGNIDALVAAGQEKASPLFKQALSGSGPVWNADLARLANRPAIQKAIALAATDLKNADINPTSMGLEIDPMMGATGAKQLQPTAQAWDLIRKNLAGTVERDTFGKPIPDSISRGNYNVNQATRDLTGALKSAIPGYGDALAASGDYLSARSAFDQGQKAILNGNVTEKQFSDMVARLDPGDQEALKGGIANKLFEQAQNGRLNPKQFLTPRAQAKLNIALGPDKAAAFTQNLQQEAGMAAFERRAIPAAGSQTAPLSQAMKEQDTFGQSQMAQDVQDALLAGHGPKGAAMQVAGNWTARQGQKVLDAIRTSGLSTAGRDEAGRLLMLPPGELAKALRAANSAGPAGPLAITSQVLRASNPALSGSIPLLLLRAMGTR